MFRPAALVMLLCLLIAPAVRPLLAADALPAAIVEQLNTAAVPRVVHVGAFSYAPSPVTGSAAWTAEYLTEASLSGDAEGRRNFRADENLPAFLRASDDDYANNKLGLVRGHLAASKNHGAKANRYETYNLSNVVPQDGPNNSGVWKTLETRIRDRVSAVVSILVVTIPLARYRDNPPLSIGARHIFVPTELGKAILVIRADEPVEMRAWIVPNSPTRETDPDVFACSMATLQERSQLDLYSFLPDDVERRLELAP